MSGAAMCVDGSVIELVKVIGWHVVLCVAICAAVYGFRSLVR